MNATTLSPQDRLLTQLAIIPPCQTPNDGADWFPPVDIAEDAEEYLFKIDLPEVTPDNLRAAVEEDGLVICGERPSPWQGDRKLLRIERPHGYFVRRFALPDDANPRRSTRSLRRVFSKCTCARSAPPCGARPRPTPRRG